jgi:hypothetical protein
MNNVQQNSRRGTATLELVLSMPILLAIIVGIVWLGFSVIAQTEVTIEARHKTWSKRNQPTGTALLFLKDDIVDDSATKTVRVSPIFDGMEPPESSHDVMAGEWDHKKMTLDKAPNWKLYALSAANAKTGSLQTSYVDGRNQFASFKNRASNLWKSLGANLIRQLTGLGNSARSAIDGAENANDGEKAKERQRINGKLQTKKQELRTARDELDNLDSEASDALRDVMKNRIKRLEAEIDDLESDLKEMD